MKRPFPEIIGPLPADSLEFFISPYPPYTIPLSLHLILVHQSPHDMKRSH